MKVKIEHHLKPLLCDGQQQNYNRSTFNYNFFFLKVSMVFGGPGVLKVFNTMSSISSVNSG